MNNKLMLIIAIVVFLGGGYLLINQSDTQEADVMTEETIMMEKDTETEKMMMETEAMEDEMIMELTEDDRMAMMTVEYDYAGQLFDVTDGPVEGYDTEGLASGVSQATYTDEDGYMLFAEFENLPILEEGYFYEGWVVRKEPFNVISTGAIELLGEKYVNTYQSAEDLTDHDFYVLTLEPDDGDPAPAGHVVEGTMTAN